MRMFEQSTIDNQAWMHISHGTPAAVDNIRRLPDGTPAAVGKKHKKNKNYKKQDEDEVHRKRRVVTDVADDDTSSGRVDLTKRLGISISIYATTSKAQVPTEKAMPSLPGATWHEGPPPKMAMLSMLSPPPKKVDASSAAATRSVLKAAVASSAAAAIDNRQSTIGVAKAAGARSAAAAASSAAASSAAASSDGAADAASSGGEAWRTTRQDITVWNEVLTAHGVDKAACQDLFLLAQHSSDGYKEANHIISKLIKKQQDKQLVTNTSAFVHKCVLNVRHKLMSQANDSWSEYSNAGWMDAHGGANPYWQWR